MSDHSSSSSSSPSSSSKDVVVVVVKNGNTNTNTNTNANMAAMYTWGTAQAEIAKTDPGKFVKEIFGPTFFSSENFLPLVNYWLPEYTQSKDRLQCFVELFKDICFGSTVNLEIYPDYINIFRNIRLTVPLTHLTRDVLILLSIMTKRWESFFATKKKYFQDASFTDCYQRPIVPIGIVVDAVLYAFIKTALAHAVVPPDICEGLGLLTGRIMALPQMTRFGHLVYESALAYKTKLKQEFKF
jgi:hypothetical protein